MNSFKKIYDSVKIPKELDNIVDDAITKYKQEKRNIEYKPAKNIVYRTILTAAASFLVIFTILINTNIAFAMSVSKIPIIGEFAKLITFTEHKIDNDISEMDIKIPIAENIENKNVEHMINDIIEQKIKEFKQEQEILDKEYKEAYLETGGTEETYNKVKTGISYELSFANDDLISFKLIKNQTLATAYNEVAYYNIDLRTGDYISLDDLYGSNYQIELKDIIRKQIKERLNKDKYAYNLEWFEQTDINKAAHFYIDDEGNIVIVFMRYEIAPGYIGMPEF